jgi:hypothetical protein
MEKNTTPRSFQSPYYAQGDIGKKNRSPLDCCVSTCFYHVPGFFSYNNRKYGQFFCAVQTFKGKILAVPIRNVKTKSLIEAIQLMIKVVSFPNHRRS